MACVALRGEPDREDLTHHLMAMRPGCLTAQPWNVLLDLRLFMGELPPATIEALGTAMARPATPSGSDARIAVVSEMAGMRFLVAFARIHFPRHTLRLFADMAAAYQWAALGEEGARLPLIMPEDLDNPLWRTPSDENDDDTGAASMSHAG